MQGGDPLLLVQILEQNLTHLIKVKLLTQLLYDDLSFILLRLIDLHGQFPAISPTSKLAMLHCGHIFLKNVLSRLLLQGGVLLTY